MALLPQQQAIELVSRATRILIATPEHPDTDAIAAAVAVSCLLTKLHKTHDVVIPVPDTQPWPAFLPDVGARDTVGAIRALHVVVDVSKTPLSELSYDVQDGTLAMTLVPSHGEWTEHDVEARPGDDRYDLVVAVGAPDMASLGQLFRDHADFLYRTPVVNIAAHPTNELWGQVNLVDLTAVSATETVARWVETWNPDLMDADLATALLTGMIAATHSFKTPNVTPLTLQLASRLMERGARREAIVHGLWRTTSVPQLKLWGRALSRLELDRERGLAWTVLSASDMAEAGGARFDGMVRDLIAYAPEAKVVAIFCEERGTARVELYAKMPLSAAELVRAFGATGTRDYATFAVTDGASFAEQVKNAVGRFQSLLDASR